MPAAAMIGAAVVGGIASNRAASKQAGAARDASQLQYQATQEARQDLAPFREAGAGVLGPLQAQALNDPFDMPFTRQEGFRDIQNSSAARGKLQSGGTLAELARYNAGITSQFDQQRFNKLYNLASLGSNAAAGQANASLSGASTQGNFLTQAGNAQAAGIMGVGNAINGGLQNYAYMNYLNNSGAGGGG